MENEFVICECYSDEHTLRFIYDGEMLWTSVYLNGYRNIFKRIFVAIKYIFGYKSKCGDWDCTIIGRKEAEKLKNFIEKFLEQGKDK